MAETLVKSTKPPAPTRWRKRAVWCALLAGVTYFGVWHRGGVRTLWGTFSGTWTPAASRGMSKQERFEETQQRARAILAAVLAYEAKNGRIPGGLEELGVELPKIPESAISTMPFGYVVKNEREFVIRWEAWPNAMYEHYRLDREGQLSADM